MVRTYKIYVWKAAPFLRLLVPVIIGIILQYYLKFTSENILVFTCCLLIPYVLVSFLPLFYRFKLRAIQGVFITLLLVMGGVFLSWNKDIRNHDGWYGNYLDSSSSIVVTIKGPPIEKAKFYKVVGSIDAIAKRDTSISSTGDVLLYIAKDSTKNIPVLGDRIVITRQLQPITNSGNPGAFDYARYSAFHQLFHQAYITSNDWAPVGKAKVANYNSFMFSLRQNIRSIIYKYVPGEEEKSIAIAILIGYKIDLDKDLVQAYSNAGVVHLIAISGLHMGIIYSILFWLFTRIPVIKKSKATRLILILFCLWFFAFLTGASGSVLRSAFMFSFISIGLTINKKASIYNSMAASAFFLLCYNPFLLWDVGFQLSYLAVLGIVISQPYISKWLFFKNKLLRFLWTLSSVSLAAQLFTFPICIFYFHQLPLLFLLSNLVAIPLMMLALWLCILLVILSPVQLLATLIGKIVFGVIWLINHTVFFINAVPFSLWDNLSLTRAETLILYATTCCFLFWLIRKEKIALKLMLGFLLVLVSIISLNKWASFNQKKIIVYNVPSHKAVDFISGFQYQFTGDDEMKIEGVLKNFHLKPGRISLMLQSGSNEIAALTRHENFYQFYNKRMLLIDTAFDYEIPKERILLDYVIVSKNPKIFIPKIAKVFNAGIYIFDASNPLWKIEKWKKDCEELHLRFHSVPEQGAFVTDL